MEDVSHLKMMASPFSVLYVEDDAVLRQSIAIYLGKLFNKVLTAVDGKEGLAMYHDDPCDIVITDISMPIMNGVELAGHIRAVNPDQVILMTSAYTDKSYLIDAIKLNVSGYMIKPIDSLQMYDALYQIVHKLDLLHENKRYKTHLEELVAEQVEHQKELEHEKIDNYEKTLESLVQLIDERDSYTGGHSQRVATYSKMIAEEMDYTEYECDLVYRAGILHDIGKIATPDAILLKPGRLNESEYELIKEHVTVGAEMLLKIPMYRTFYHVIIAHHERLDGSGYPSGLIGDEIPPLARIMMVADSFDAMTTNRIYKGKKSVEEAIEELKALSSTHYDPDVVDAAAQVFSHTEVLQTTQRPKSAMEQERFAYYYRDQVADVYNRDYLDVVLARNQFEKTYRCMNIFLLHDFTRYNAKYDWQSGDAVLSRLAGVLKKLLPDALLFRIHGDDFVAIEKEHHEIKTEDLQVFDFLKELEITLEQRHFHIEDDHMLDLKEFERHFSM